MKNIFRIPAFLLILLFAVSCEQKFKAEEPEIISFTYDPDPVVAGTYVAFTAEVVADYATIWFGTETSNYDAYLEQPTSTNKGGSLVLEYDKFEEIYKGVRSNNYTVPGTYKVVLVVTNVGDMGDELLTKTQVINLEVQPAPASTE